MILLKIRVPLALPVQKRTVGRLFLKHWQSQWHTRMPPLAWRGSFRQPTIVFHQLPRPVTSVELLTPSKESLR